MAIVTTGNRSEYTVRRVTAERGGVYRCNVSNSIGSGSLDFTVQSKSVHKFILPNPGDLLEAFVNFWDTPPPKGNSL